MAISPHTHRFEDNLYSKLEEMTVFPHTVTGHLHEAIKDYLVKLGDTSLATTPLAPRRVAKRFTKPDVPALALYFHSRGSVTCNDDANSFFDHYESNGWKVGGKGAMKCWKAAVRNWMKRGKQYENNKPGVTQGQNKREAARNDRQSDLDRLLRSTEQPHNQNGGSLDLVCQDIRPMLHSPMGTNDQQGRDGY